MGDWEQKNHLINELAEGRELAKQLQSYLNLPFSPNETQEVLVQRIIASYEKALSMLNCSVGTSSPPSLNGSPRSDQDSDPEHRNTRKSMPKWTKQVRVGPGMGIEGPLEDGFSWRKYGQKDILGAKHPRGYYRCTHRHGRGCLATKQVQRSDEDPTILDVSYKGSHTCNNSSSLAAAAPPPPAADQTHQQPTQQNQSEEQLLMNYFRTGLKVLTDDLHTNHQDNTVIPSFHYPSSSNIQNWQNNLAENFTPPFLSPATSGTSYFSASPSGFNSYQNFQSDQLTEIISSSAATSGTNSPTIGNLDFQFGNAHEFDPHFTFDNPGFFS
ncbi:probable WRKY transcription factor 30 isoform X2 [Tripterygium wilfordii]|uniref:probable WRKY transcription factor 30 isoform X2 n=1 Tax=Tripterygium wilfordii TaxID=458696 RepID=UPI0018F80A1B|nr:probable WRKY transcription factor 30 isoform X2 [Tripterygium wilfordii]